MRNSKLYFAILISISTFAAMQESAATTPNWNQPTESRISKASSPAIVTANQPLIEHGAHWERVAGCARDISAGENGVVYVTGCDVVPNSHGSSSFYRWNGAAFLPLAVPGHGSAIATFGGNSYTIGGDAMLYSSINDGEWVKRGTPNNQPITDIGAGRAGIWIITSQPNTEAGNAISRSQRCPTSAITGGKDFCGWAEMSGAGVRISVGAGAWVVNAQGHIYEWRDGSNQWQKRPGCFTDVAANGENVYAVGCKPGNGDGNAIYRWNNAGSWVDVQGAGKRVAVDAAGNAWAITDSGEIWRRDNHMAPGTPR
jgi:Tectonin domain